jgi:hypothetical protein
MALVVLEPLLRYSAVSPITRVCLGFIIGGRDESKLATSRI